MTNSFLDRLQRGLVGPWQIYMAWYISFITVNMVVMGWLVTRPDLSVPRRRMEMLAISWSVFNLLGMAATLAMGCYTKSVTHQIPEKSVCFPVRAARLAAYANSTVLLINAAQWIVILLI